MEDSEWRERERGGIHELEILLLEDLEVMIHRWKVVGREGVL